MSSLWTPGGEIPVDRNASPPAAEPAPAPGAGQSPAPGAGQSPGPGDDAPDDAAVRAQMEQMRRQLLEAPAEDVIAQHLIAFYELAALHLDADPPGLSQARLAIDAIEAVVTGLEGRLGQAGAALAEALPQLKMAVVEAGGRSQG